MTRLTGRWHGPVIRHRREVRLFAALRAYLLVDPALFARILARFQSVRQGISPINGSSTRVSPNTFVRRKETCLWHSSLLSTLRRWTSSPRNGFLSGPFWTGTPYGPFLLALVSFECQTALYLVSSCSTRHYLWGSCVQALHKWKIDSLARNTVVFLRFLNKKTCRSQDSRRFARHYKHSSIRSALSFHQQYPIHYMTPDVCVYGYLWLSVRQPLWIRANLESVLIYGYLWIYLWICSTPTHYPSHKKYLA